MVGKAALDRVHAFPTENLDLKPLLLHIFKLKKKSYNRQILRSINIGQCSDEHYFSAL